MHSINNTSLTHTSTATSYINQAESLRGILDQILEYYFDYESDYKIEEVDSKYLINFAMDDQSLKYEIDIEPNALCEFLNELAELVDRQFRWQQEQSPAT